MSATVRARESGSSLPWLIYRAVLEADRWLEVLDAIRLHLGCECACLAVDSSHWVAPFPALAGEGEPGCPRGIGPATLRAALACPRAAVACREVHGRGGCPCSQPCEWQSAEPCTIVSVERGRRPTDGARAALVVRWADSNRAVARGDGARLVVVTRELAAALRVRQQVDALRGAIGAAALVLDCVPEGVLVVDGEARVLHAGDDHALGELLAGAAHGAPAASTAEAGVLAIPRRSGAPPYTLRALPVGGVESARSRRAPAAVVFVVETARDAALSAVALTRLFGLTRAQARLAAALADGDTLDEAARRMAIAPKTARVHLGNVFRRLGIHRQSDLVRLLQACSARFRLPGSVPRQVSVRRRR